MKKKAELLTENVIFIILNIAFFSILAFFIVIKSDNLSLVEEAYAKKIALIIDATSPGMEIQIDMKSAIDRKKADYTGKIVSIDGNLVHVKLRQEGGYTYSFFNDVLITKEYFYARDDEGVYKFEVKEKK